MVRDIQGWSVTRTGVLCHPPVRLWPHLVLAGWAWPDFSPASGTPTWGWWGPQEGRPPAYEGHARAPGRAVTAYLAPRAHHCASMGLSQHLETGFLILVH